MMKKRVITWTLLVALTAAVPAFGIFGIPSPEDLLIWFVLRPIMHGNQRAMIANQIEQLRQLVEQLQTARSQLTHVTDSVQGLVGPIADPIADLVRAPTDLLNTTRDWHSDFTGPAGDMVTSLGDLTANGESFSRSWRDVLGAADTVIEADIRNVYPGSADRRWPSFSAGATTPIAAWNMPGSGPTQGPIWSQSTRPPPRPWAASGSGLIRTPIPAGRTARRRRSPRAMFSARSPKSAP